MFTRYYASTKQNHEGDWQRALFGITVAIGMVCVLALLVIYSSPSEVGLRLECISSQPFTTEPEEQDCEGVHATPQKDVSGGGNDLDEGSLTLRQAKSCTIFWTLNLGYGIFSVLWAGFNLHALSIFREAGGMGECGRCALKRGLDPRKLLTGTRVLCLDVALVSLGQACRIRGRPSHMPFL